MVSRSGTAAAPITFSGIFQHAGALSTDSALLTIKNAQYINLDRTRAIGTVKGGTAAVSLVNAQHINLSRSTLYGVGSMDGLYIDGNSSDVNVTACSCHSDSGTVINAAVGASDLTVTSSLLYTNPSATSTGVEADGTTNLRIAGVTVDTSAGTGITIAGSSSGSIENTVISPLARTQIKVTAESVASVTEDYNAVTADGSSTYYTAYNWGGKTYHSSADFYAATGQGQHDVDTLTNSAFPIAEGSPVIDSGDASAPGESATDFFGHPRVDDPNVPNSGTGSGTTDRGAYEFQNPFSISAVSMTPFQGPAPLPVTVTAAVQNPWSTPITGYTFDFGDGTSAQDSTEPALSHTFQNPVTPAGGSYTVTVTAHRADGVSSKSTGTIQVGSPGPLVPQLTFGTASSQPDSVMTTPSAISPWAVTGHTVDYGDGSPVVHADGAKPQLPEHTFPAPGTYTVTDTATDAGGRTATSSRQLTVGTSFIPLASPQRVLDTRNGTGARKAKVGPGGVVKVKVAGASGIPGSGVAAVTMNVTDTNASADSWITAYADGSPRPTASNLNFRAGQTNPNLVTVPVGKDGYVDLWNGNGSVDLIGDIQGYFSTAPVAGSVDIQPAGTYFVPMTPTRVVDTRSGLGGQKVPLGPGQCLSHAFTYVLPSSGRVAAAVLSVTATGADSGSLITVYPAGQAEPSTSNLNFQAGQTTSSMVVAPVDDSPSTLFCNHAGHVQLLVDLQGYYFNFSQQPATGYLPMAPTRLVDTRNGTGTLKQRLGANATLRIKVAGTHGIPDGATAALVNLTGVAPSASTWLTTYGSGKTPTTSVINLLPGQIRPVLTSVPIDSSGYITVYNANGNIDVVADLEGYYAPIA
nr:PKD domain-containing protein [Streptomyces sp. 846.5]